LIEISRAEKKLYIALIEDFENPQNHMAIDLPLKVAIKLMNENENKFEKLIS